MASYLLRRAITKLSIIASDELLGFCSNPNWSKSTYRELEGGDQDSLRVRATVEKAVMIFCAGGAAEKVRFRKSKPDHLDADMRCALDFADRISGSPEESKALLKWLWLRTVNMMKVPRNRELVEILAAELLDRREISGRRVKSIIRDAIETQILKGISPPAAS